MIKKFTVHYLLTRVLMSLEGVSTCPESPLPVDDLNRSLDQAFR